MYTSNLKTYIPVSLPTDAHQNLSFDNLFTLQEPLC